MEGREGGASGTRSAACGCLAACAFLILVGLPVLFAFSFGLSPCRDGPCDPNGKRNLAAVAALLLALAALAGLATWRLLRQRALRRSGRVR